MASSVHDLAKLLTKATSKGTSSSAALDVTSAQSQAVKAIKAVCKSTPAAAAKELMRCLLLVLSTSRSTAVKLRALAVMDEVFWRCRAFREEVSANIRALAKHTKLTAAATAAAAAAAAAAADGSNSSSNGNGNNGAGAQGLDDGQALQERLQRAIVLWDGCYGQVRVPRCTSHAAGRPLTMSITPPMASSCRSFGLSCVSCRKRSKRRCQT